MSATPQSVTDVSFSVEYSQNAIIPIVTVTATVSNETASEQNYNYTVEGPDSGTGFVTAGPGETATINEQVAPPSGTTWPENPTFTLVVEGDIIDEHTFSLRCDSDRVDCSDDTITRQALEIISCSVPSQIDPIADQGTFTATVRNNGDHPRDANVLWANADTGETIAQTVGATTVYPGDTREVLRVVDWNRLENMVGVGGTIPVEVHFEGETDTIQCGSVDVVGKDFDFDPQRVVVEGCMVTETETGYRFAATIQNNNTTGASVTVEWQTSDGTTAAQVHRTVDGQSSQPVSVDRRMSELRSVIGLGSFDVTPAVSASTS